MYDTSYNDILEIVQEQDDKVEKLMIFGHNPEFTFLCNELCDYDLYNLPTTGIFCVEFEVDKWSDIQVQTGKFVFFEYPKKYFPKEEPKTQT